jgi:two-component system KDP operon response regulator KdpE
MDCATMRSSSFIPRFWQYVFVLTEYLRVYMRQLRKKLEPDPERPQHIVTEPGIGYRFIADE